MCLANTRWCYNVTSFSIITMMSQWARWRFFRRRSKKTSKLRVTGLCVGYFTTGDFPAPRVRNANFFSFDDVIMLLGRMHGMIHGIRKKHASYHNRCENICGQGREEYLQSRISKNLKGVAKFQIDMTTPNIYIGVFTRSYDQECYVILKFPRLFFCSSAVVSPKHRGLHISLRWRHNGCDSVSNHQPHDFLLNRLFSRWPVNSLHKWPVTRKMLPFDDVIMCIPTQTIVILIIYENEANCMV